MASGTLVDSFIETLRAMDGSTASAAVLGVLLLCGLGLPMPEDVILITSGFLASMGKFPLWWGVLSGMIGVLSGDAVLFFLGRRYGEGVLRWPIFSRWVGGERVEEARRRVQGNAHFICFIARFLPGLRSPIYLMAGALGIPPRVYVSQDFLAASISVPFWVVFGWYFGAQIETALVMAGKFQRSFLVVLAIGIAVWVWRKWRAARAETPGEGGTL